MQLEKMKIEQIEQQIDKLSAKSRESEKQKYERLEYLRTSKRFKENSQYKKSSFWDYLEDRFTIREKTYRENTDAFMKYPGESIQYGVGLVSRIRRQCGKDKAQRTFDKIKAAQDKRKTPLRRDQIDEIINAVSPKIKRTINDWHAMYEAETAAHERTKDALQEAFKEITQKNIQINKLKQTVEAFEVV